MLARRHRFSEARLADQSMRTAYTNQPTAKFTSAFETGEPDSKMAHKPMYSETRSQQNNQALEAAQARNPAPATVANVPSGMGFEQSTGLPYSSLPVDRTDGHNPGSNFAGLPWLWADADPSVDVFSGFDLSSFDVNMDLEGEVNWYNG